jgi:thiamine biosynthesis lipoprotein
LPALVAAGYDRSFDRILAAEPVAALVLPVPPPPQRVDSTGVLLGPGRQITLPAGVALDLGGIAKGWTAQQAVDRLGMWGPCMVDAGGDIACTGTPPSEPWVVTVANPEDEERDLAILSLQHEAVATSSRVKRRWTQVGQPAHHLIDPRTGAPALTNVLSVTVVAPRLPAAEIHAKTALILGEAQGLAYLSALPDVSALLVTEDGRQVMSGGFEEKAYDPSISNFADRFRNPA